MEEAITRGVLRNALVKLGDTETQQQYWCWLIHETVDTPVGVLRAIGGWFSIQALDAVLDGAGEAAFIQAIRRTPPTDDVGRIQPRLAALLVLPEILPDGPKVGLTDANASRVWREWIADHRDELMSRKPTGAGVIFTENACKGIAVDGWR